MLSDEVIEKVTERLITRLEDLNEYVLKDIARTLKKAGTLNPKEAHQLVKILKYGGDYKKIAKKISEITNINVEDIYKIFEEVAKSNYEFAEQFYRFRNKRYIPFDENTALQNQIKSIAQQTIEKYINFSNTRSIGFSLRDRDGKTIFRSIEETYKDSIDRVILSVSQGKGTLDDELYSIMKDIGNSGLKYMDYKSGHSRRLDSSLRMAIKDGLSQLHNENQILFGEQFDSDGVEITVHSYPAPDHEEVQGRQFSTKRPSKNELSEFEKFQNDKDCKDVTGKEFPAEVDGRDRRSIGQYNCYHKVFSIIVGVSQPRYTDKELQKIIDDNEKGFEFEGKKYNLYEGTQLQRQIETEIRKQKDLMIMAQEGGSEKLAQESQKKINQLTNKYYELSKVSGLPTKLERMQVDGYKQIKLQENIPVKPEINSSELMLDESENEKTPLNKVVDGNFYQTSKVFKNSKQHLDLTNNENINIYNATNNLQVHIHENKRIKKAHYSRWDREIYTTGYKDDTLQPTTTLWHEIGHALDNNNLVDYLSNNVEMRTSMTEYMKKHRETPESLETHLESFKKKSDAEFESKNNYKDFYDNFIEIKEKEGESEYNLGVYKSRKESNIEDYERMVENDYHRKRSNYYYEKKKNEMDYAQMGNLSDIFSALSQGKYNRDVCRHYGYHPSSYFDEWKNATTEMFADFVSLKMTDSKIHLDYLKKEAPEVYKQLEKLYKEIGDDLGER